MRVLWLIPARAGSKALPQKNILPLGGIPLLAWRIRTALHLGGSVWLSTDSADYAAIGKLYGAQVPFLRPADLATDEASSADVCLHAMRFAMGQGDRFDAIGLLQPTSPFVSTASLQRGVQALMQQAQAHAAIAVREVRSPSALVQPLAPTLEVLAARLGEGKDVRRQVLPAEITPCGAFYIARWENFLQKPTFYMTSSIPVLIRDLETIDIDTEQDLAFAEFCVQSGRVLS